MNEEEIFIIIFLLTETVKYLYTFHQKCSKKIQYQNKPKQLEQFYASKDDTDGGNLLLRGSGASDHLSTEEQVRKCL